MKSVSRFLLNRKISMMKTILKSSAEYVTPQRMGGRVAPINSGSTDSPGLRSRIAVCSDAKQTANPGHYLGRTEGDRDSQDGANAPAPRHSVCHCHAAQDHDKNDGNGRQPG